jgi:hypothetical protein
MALNLARWTLRDKAAQRRLALRWAQVALEEGCRENVNFLGASQ